MNKTYICIDLKSFYASCEASMMGFDPLDTNLVVADISRTEKTICLAVSPSLKEYKIPGRARLFQVVEAVKNINKERIKYAYNHRFIGKSYYKHELDTNPNLELDYVIAKPHMQKYIDFSNLIYSIYLKYISEEDIYIYSIDECFIDLTNYLSLYKTDAYTLTKKLIYEVLEKTHITATAGIGENLFLAKIAMDVLAKKEPADENGVRIASLTVKDYRRLLWHHTPITDFWRVGNGIAKKLDSLGIHTMYDIACISISKDKYYNEDLLYKTFGVNAEILIDHAWGLESITLEDIKSYKPEAKSLSNGQVLHCPYSYNDTKLIIKEMTDELTLQLVEKNLYTNQISLYLGYDISSLNNYKGEVKKDYLGRIAPKPSTGSIRLDITCNSVTLIKEKMNMLYEQIVNKDLLIRRINMAFNIVEKQENKIEQLSLFEDYDKKKEDEEKLNKFMKKEENVQKAIIDIKNKYGKNAVVKALDLEENANQIERNNQIGGHSK